METNTTDSSVISSYIHRFRYSRPTAPNERNPLSQKEAFWWLKEDESNVDRDNESEQMNSNTKDLSTYSEDSLDQRDISSLPQKIEQPKVSDSIGSYSIHNEDLSSQGLSEILHSMETISTEASSEVNLRSQESLPSSSSTTSSYSARHSYDPSILETLVKHKGIIPTTQHHDDDSRYVNSDEEQECVDEEEEVEEVLDMDDHMRQIIRQCNRMAKDLKQNTAQLNSKAQQKQLQRKNEEEITITKEIPNANKSNKTTRSNNYNNARASSPPPPPPLRPESPRARVNYLVQRIAQETANGLRKENNRDDHDCNEEEEDDDEAEEEEVRSSVEAETETESMWARYTQSASSHHHQKRNKEDDDNSRKDTRYNKEKEDNETSSSAARESGVLFTAEDDAVHELLKEFNLFSPPSHPPVPPIATTAPLSPIAFSSPIIKKIHSPPVTVAVDRDDKDDDKFSGNNKKDKIESVVATASIANSTNLPPLSPLPLKQQLSDITVDSNDVKSNPAPSSSSSVIPSSPSLLYFLSSDEEDNDDDDDDKDSDQDEEQHIQQKRRQRRNETSEQTLLPHQQYPVSVAVDAKINANVKAEIELDPTEVQAYLHDDIVSQLWSRLLEVRSMIQQHHHHNTR